MTRRGVSTEGVARPFRHRWRRRLPRWIHRIGLSLLVVAALLSGGLGFGMGCEDAARVRAFSTAVRRWQTDPDFRHVQNEYVTLGADAMRARLCGISADAM